MARCAAHERSQLVNLEVPFRLSTFTNSDHRPSVAAQSLPDGSVYYGLVSPDTGMPDGMGTVLAKNGDTYSGEFCSGLRHGWGMGIRPASASSLYGATDGCIRYEGVWDNNTRHGYGFLRVNRGVRYFGQFSRHQRHGRGLVIVSEGREQAWATVWQNNVCVSKSTISGASVSGACNAPPGDSDLATGAQSDGEQRSSFSDSSGDADYTDVLRPEHWSAECVAAALTSAGVDAAISDLIVREQITGRVSAILMANGLLNESLRRLGVTNPYVRRYCMLIFYGLLSLHGPNSTPTSRAGMTPASSPLGPGALSLPTSELSIKNLYLERRIGEGGYGRVYRGRYDFGGGARIQVACKVFQPSELWRKNKLATKAIGTKPTGTRGGSSANGGSLSFVLGPNLNHGLREFETELANHCRLHHPNVVKHYGVIRHPLYSVISEYVPCGSLFDLLHRHRRKLSLQSWLKISEQLSYALSYLHSRRIIHCDLKTSNILITQNGDIKVCDFGLSRTGASQPPPSSVSGGSAPQPGCGAGGGAGSSPGIALGCIGTIQWMSPEALRGEMLSYASDIYSLGIILWEILSGEIPYKNQSHERILALVGYAGLSLLNTSISGSATNAPIYSLPPNVINVIKACLHPSPKCRPTAQKLTHFFQQGRQSKFLDFEHNLKTFFGL